MASADEQAVLEKRIKLYKTYRRRENFKQFRKEDFLEITRQDLLERLELCVGLSEAVVLEYAGKTYDLTVEKMNQAFEHGRKKLLLRIEANERSIKKQKQ